MFGANGYQYICIFYSNEVYVHMTDVSKSEL